MSLYAYIDTTLFGEFIAKQELEGIPYDVHGTRHRFLKEVGTPRIVSEHDEIASESHFWYGFHYYQIPQGINVKYNTTWPGYKYSTMYGRFIKE